MYRGYRAGVERLPGGAPWAVSPDTSRLSRLLGLLKYNCNEFVSIRLAFLRPCALDSFHAVYRPCTFELCDQACSRVW